MTNEDQEKIRKLIRTTPKSLWGYLAFVAPVIVVIIGIAIQFILLAYFKNHFGDFEVCIRRGEQVERLWNNDLVKEVVLIVSLSTTATFGLLAWLASISFRQITLLRKAAKELGIEASPVSK